MEWRVYMSHKGTSYKSFKVKQNNNLDLQVIPYNSVIISKAQIKKLPVGKEISFEFTHLKEEVDHFTLHNKYGKKAPVKHVRLKTLVPPYEPSIIEKGLRYIARPIPLLTIVSSLSQHNIEEPKKSGLVIDYQKIQTI